MKHVWLITAAFVMATTSCSRDKHVLPVAADDFERDVLASPMPTVVEFWAHGCMPCIALARPLEKVARTYEGRVSFRKLNAGWTAATRYRYHFDAVPTLIFYRDGHEVARQVGRPEGDDYDGLVQFVEAGLAAPLPPDSARSRM
jgi:thioredoxin-like negative regulator of GroEL